MFIFPQDKPSLQLQHMSSRTTTAAGGDVHLQVSHLTVTSSPARGFPFLLILRRSAGPAGSSLPEGTTPTTARAPARSHWEETSEQPITPQCAPSCMHSSSLAMKWEHLVVCPTDSSLSACYILMTRRTWF